MIKFLGLAILASIPVSSCDPPAAPVDVADARVQALWQTDSNGFSEKILSSGHRMYLCPDLRFCLEIHQCMLSVDEPRLFVMVHFAEREL